MYIQINIGRNIGNQPMSANLWEAYRADVESLLISLAEHDDMDAEPVEVHQGKGAWNNSHEDSAHISRYHEGGFDIDGIREELKHIKKAYSQESIALIVGSELI